MGGARRHVVKHELTDEDSIDRDMWRNLVLGEGKSLYSRQSSDELNFLWVASLVRET
jgi:hypothetical protein